MKSNHNPGGNSGGVLGPKDGGLGGANSNNSGGGGGANNMLLAQQSSFSIRDKQIESCNRMLNIKSGGNHDTGKTNWQEVWKVLVFDQYCSTIIAPILTKAAQRSPADPRRARNLLCDADL
ncbi:hypothetical protein PPL_00879 [Heterostelium album PN500]|uniref:Uncharacterized protein n=1 Tax=Heterostelium pallidum (strain ATCC 26659 / Pp 5 / PN500) TaxID=670386 RepID=D3AYW0_HETP5|nr:hypothetical protein PPL_00879 [Heterostelium album PN500]EFA85650.1 hypothetical protein PPL_00879 [Heterostelium album PN500]|eukprot:XP_020437757.1 hypothetical protein PPL_00879 [Heterostelium album PN500]